MAVAAAGDTSVLAAVTTAARAKLCDAILIGDEASIRKQAEHAGVDLSGHRILHEPDATSAAVRAVRCVASGEAHILMKGMLPTATFLRPMLDKEHGLRSGGTLSHVGVLEIPVVGRLVAITDYAMNVSPDLSTKVSILRNAIAVMRRLGFARPKVAVLAPVETVNPNVPSTVDAAILSKMADRGEFGSCEVDGPLALDVALSEEAARHKGVSGPVAGRADILLVPDLNAGNLLYKALIHLAGARAAAIVVGARVPAVLASRADPVETKLYSIALGLLACVPDGNSAPWSDGNG